MATDRELLLAGLPRESIEEATKLGLKLASDIDAANWSKLVAGLIRNAARVTSGRDTLTAWLGDVLAYGDGKYRGQIVEYAQASGMSPGTLRDAKLVCGRIPVSCRRDTLSWSHHCEIAKAFADSVAIEHWLTLASNEQLSKMELRRRIRLHVAEAAGNRTVPPAHGAAFVMLRELRAASRLVQQHTDAWAKWSPAACRLALAEIEPLVALVDKLRARLTAPPEAL